MSSCLNRAVKAMRYWLFPQSRVIDERTERYDQERQALKQQKEQTDRLVKNATQADVLRNLVINMSQDRRTL